MPQEEIAFVPSTLAARDAVYTLFHDLRKGLVDDEGTRVDLHNHAP
jgi:hypothetical protein